MVLQDDFMKFVAGEGGAAMERWRRRRRRRGRIGRSENVAMLWFCLFSWLMREGVEGECCIYGEREGMGLGDHVASGTRVAVVFMMLLCAGGVCEERNAVIME